MVEPLGLCNPAVALLTLQASQGSVQLIPSPPLFFVLKIEPIKYLWQPGVGRTVKRNKSQSAFQKLVAGKIYMEIW